MEENARWDGSKRRSGRSRAGGRNTVEWSLEGREEEVGMEGIGGEASGNQRLGWTKSGVRGEEKVGRDGGKRGAGGGGVEVGTWEKGG